MAESQEATRKRRRMSKVWDHFPLKNEDNKVQCVYCKAELEYPATARQQWFNILTESIQLLTPAHQVSLTQANINIDVS